MFLNKFTSYLIFGLCSIFVLLSTNNALGLLHVDLCTLYCTPATLHSYITVAGAKL